MFEYIRNGKKEEIPIKAGMLFDVLEGHFSVSSLLYGWDNVFETIIQDDTIYTDVHFHTESYGNDFGTNRFITPTVYTRHSANFGIYDRNVNIMDAKDIHELHNMLCRIYKSQKVFKHQTYYPGTHNMALFTYDNAGNKFMSTQKNVYNAYTSYTGIEVITEQPYSNNTDFSSENIREPEITSEIRQHKYFSFGKMKNDTKLTVLSHDYEHHSVQCAQIGYTQPEITDNSMLSFINSNFDLDFIKRNTRPINTYYDKSCLMYDEQQEQGDLFYTLDPVFSVIGSYNGEDNKIGTYGIQDHQIMKDTITVDEESGTTSFTHAVNKYSKHIGVGDVIKIRITENDKKLKNMFAKATEAIYRIIDIQENETGDFTTRASKDIFRRYTVKGLVPLMKEDVYEYTFDYANQCLADYEVPVQRKPTSYYKDNYHNTQRL